MSSKNNIKNVSIQNLLKLIQDENMNIENEIKTNFKKIKHDKADNLFLEKTFKSYNTYINSEISKKEDELKKLKLLKTYLEKIIDKTEDNKYQEGGASIKSNYSNYRLIQGKYELEKINKRIDNIKRNLLGF
tara:strand:- start:98 stop:493 length:396 start_codon:yes stop_codon:yes gene_type:complete